MENSKSTKTDHEKCLSKEYTRALSLLYSSESKSADELRLMLEIEIAKQNRSKRSKLRTRQKRSKRQKISVDLVDDKCSVTSENSLQTNNTMSDKKMEAPYNLNSNIEEGGSRDDIPRISIPDEDQNNEAVCKVCNVPEFGPLTLAQCSACEKYYHSLCHQPPIVDACFQESNSLWQCGECGKNDHS